MQNKGTEIDAQEPEEATAEALGAGAVAEEEETPPKKRRGRPKGYPKSGGRIKGSVPSTHKIRETLQRNALAVIEQQVRIATGERILCAGPTGKPVWRYPTLAEQSKAGEVLLAKLLPDLKSEQSVGLLATVSANATEADAAALRKAALEDYIARIGPHDEGAGGCTGDLIGASGRATERSLVSYDTLPNASPKNFEPSQIIAPLDGGGVSSTPDEIAAFDRAPRMGDRIELGTN
jgi:hypothetical protein